MPLPQVMLACLMSRDGTEISLPRCLPSNALPAVHPIRDPSSQLGDPGAGLFVCDRLHPYLSPIGYTVCESF